LDRDEGGAGQTTAAIIGGGPAGLMAAEILAGAGLSVTLYEALPSVGRKLLMAGRGGLNLTNAEPEPAFLARYGPAAERLAPALDRFGPQELRDWAAGLGIETFIGSSDRVFPVGLKASPLLRAWLRRLAASGVGFRLRHRWIGFGAEGALRFETPEGAVEARPGVIVLAPGGASWPRLGSTGAWASILGEAGIALAPFRPSNCGFVIGWSAEFATRWAGTPLKTIRLGHRERVVEGEAMVTASGIEGGAVYALSSGLRDAIERDGAAILGVDLKPGLDEAALVRRLTLPRRGASLGNFLRKAAGLSPVAIALLRELHGGALPQEAAALARAIKSGRLILTAPAAIDRAISTAGGLRLEAIDENFMLRDLPGVFVAGEMLDWEAPTGGYLLQACLATGKAAAEGALCWLRGRE
jgi:uncharacterized flavoprotein (TIGR03862 family)